MRERTFKKIWLSLVFGGVLLGLPSFAFAECGDVNGDDQVLTIDALMVLRKAVGTSNDVMCSCTTTTTQPPHEDCFSDDDCGATGAEYCCANVCSECSENEHCPEGFECDGSCSCIPIP